MYGNPRKYTPEKAGRTMQFSSLKIGDIFNTKLSRYIKVDLQERTGRRPDGEFLVNAVALVYKYAGQGELFSDDMEVVLIQEAQF